MVPSGAIPPLLPYPCYLLMSWGGGLENRAFIRHRTDTDSPWAESVRCPPPTGIEVLSSRWSHLHLGSLGILKRKPTYTQGKPIYTQKTYLYPRVYPIAGLVAKWHLLL